jgi:hypothetical protein
MLIILVSHCDATGSSDLWWNVKSERCCANAGLIRRSNQELRSFLEVTANVNGRSTLWILYVGIQRIHIV